MRRVLPCSKRFCHDWTVCPYSHPGEKAKRRDPRLYSYTGIACPDMKKVPFCSFSFCLACMHPCREIAVLSHSAWSKNDSRRRKS